MDFALQEDDPVFQKQVAKGHLTLALIALRGVTVGSSVAHPTFRSGVIEA
jgi:hypothetical protein